MSHIPTFLLDTCVISAGVNSQMKSNDAVGFAAMQKADANGEILLYGSTVTLEEHGAIPERWRSSHSKAYNMLPTMRALDAIGLDSCSSSSNFGKPRGDAGFDEIREILSGQNDARLAYQAKTEGAVLVTLDDKTILKKASTLALRGVYVMRPSEFLTLTGKSC